MVPRGGGHGADPIVWGNPVQKIGQDGAVAIAAGGELDGSDVGRGCIHREMHLAPLASTLDTVLAGLPFTVAQELDPGAVHQQIQRPRSATIGDLNLQGLLPAAEGRIVRHGPVQPRQAQEARDHPGGLPQRELEQHLDRETELDRRVREDRRTPRVPFMRREPGHLLVEPPSHTCRHVLPGNGSAASRAS